MILVKAHVVENGLTARALGQLPGGDCDCHCSYMELTVLAPGLRESCQAAQSLEGWQPGLQGCPTPRTVLANRRRTPAPLEGHASGLLPSWQWWSHYLPVRDHRS